MRHHGFGGAWGGFAVLAITGAARAEGGETMPLAVAQRPLTLPRLTVAPTLGVDFSHVERDAKRGLQSPLNLDVSARFGVLDDFEISAVVLPLQMLPSVAYKSPRFEATFRLLKGVVELGARLGMTFVRQDEAQGVAIETGVPVLIHLGDVGRIDMGVFVPMDFNTGTAVSGDLTGQSKTGAAVSDDLPGQSTAIGLRLPIQLLYNVLPTFYLGARTGVGTAHVSDAGRHLDVPLGILGGYSFGSEKHAFVDVNGYFTFSSLVRGDTINPRDFKTGVSATMFFYF